VTGRRVVCNIFFLTDEMIISRDALRRSGLAQIFFLRALTFSLGFSYYDVKLRFLIGFF